MLLAYTRTSRPRFWLYLLGPYLIGIAAAPQFKTSWHLLLLGLFFSYPANLLVYGFNDIFDYETDKHNPKKQQYETLLAPDKRKTLLRHLTAWGILGMLLVMPSNVPQAAKWAMTGFYFFGLLYSAPPVRAKTKPFLDSVFNVLYVFPGLISYGLITGFYPPLRLFAAASLWCMAMHAYSAIPDISADKKAKIRTIATWLGARGTLFFCLSCYLGSATLSYPWLKGFSIFGGGVYGLMMLVSLASYQRSNIFRLYTWFPLINMLVGMGLFFWVALM